MDLRATLLFLVLGFGLCQALPKRVGIKVVGGENAKPEEFPFQISLQRLQGAGRSHSCGGSIIDTTHILTASHCVVSASPTSIVVVLGANNITNEKEASQVVHNVKTITIHPLYPSQGSPYDIAVLELESEIQYTSAIQPIQMCQEAPTIGSHLTVTGWGATNPIGTETPDILQKLTSKLISNDQCNNRHESLLCVESIENGEINGSCFGDSGGPLHYIKESGEICQYGVVVSGPSICGTAPQIYSSATYFTDFINENSSLQ